MGATQSLQLSLQMVVVVVHPLQIQKAHSMELLVALVELVQELTLAR
jgi:hypothetical protein